ncbi:MAG: hypothetical protein OEW26_04425, partial [Nitrospirota bacterium]|nr:hypothetical protein [Nitrospirota bacterium]
GDGWNGAFMSITDNTGLFYFGNTFSSGLSAVFYECLPTGCYNVSVTAGDFPSEISWNIYTYDNYYGTIELLVSGSGASIAHFGAGGDCQGLGCVNPVACNYNPLATSSGGFCCLDNCLTVYLYDVFGDGWNGAEYTIRDWNNEIRQHGTLYSGAYGTDLSCLPDGCYTIDVTGGSFPAEVSWYLIGSTVYIYGAGTSSDSFTVGTGSPGCTQPYASNYNVDATCDDGTCVFSCDADLNNDGTVNVTDLLLFMSQFGVNC